MLAKSLYRLLQSSSLYLLFVSPFARPPDLLTSDVGLYVGNRRVWLTIINIPSYIRDKKEQGRIRTTCCTLSSVHRKTFESPFGHHHQSIQTFIYCKEGMCQPQHFDYNLQWLQLLFSFDGCGIFTFSKSLSKINYVSLTFTQRRIQLLQSDKKHVMNKERLPLNKHLLLTV